MGRQSGPGTQCGRHSAVHSCESACFGRQGYELPGKRRPGHMQRPSTGGNQHRAAWRPLRLHANRQHSCAPPLVLHVSAVPRAHERLRGGRQLSIVVPLAALLRRASACGQAATHSGQQPALLGASRYNSRVDMKSGTCCSSLVCRIAIVCSQAAAQAAAPHRRALNARPLPQGHAFCLLSFFSAGLPKPAG